MTPKEKLFDYMNKAHNVVLLDQEMSDIQTILFPPSYPYKVTDDMLTQYSNEQLLSLAEEIIKEKNKRIENQLPF